MLFYRRSYRPEVGALERFWTVAGVAGLAALIAWFQHRGRQVDPGLFRLDESSLATDAPARTIYERELVVLTSHAVDVGKVEGLLAPVAPGSTFRRTGPVEVYPPARLYQKINGRETLYKTYGFRMLYFAGYQLGDETLDVEVFEQASPMQAFGVFSTERQGLAGAVLEPTRTVTANGVYLVEGPYYVRIQGSSDSATIRRAADALAAHLAKGLADASEGTPAPASASGSAPGSASRSARPPARPPAEGSGAAGTPEGAEASGGPPAEPAASSALAALLADPSSWTPARNPLVELGADPGSLEYHAEYGMGFEGFAGLFVASLGEGEAGVRAFLLPAADAAAAAEIYQSYRDQVLDGEDGSDTLPWPGAPPAHGVCLRSPFLGTYEVAFVAGRFVAGLTEVADPEAGAAALARVVGALGAGG